MGGPTPNTEREYLMEIYHRMTTVCEVLEKHDDRLCNLETAHQNELLWRNRLIGAGIGLTLAIPILTALAMRVIG